MPSADGCRNAGCARRGGGQAAHDPDCQIPEGLRFEHVAVEAHGFYRVYGAVESGADHFHHHRIVASSAGDQQPGGRFGAMLHPFHHRGGDGGGERGGGIGVGQGFHRLAQSRKGVSVQRFRRHLQEIGIGEEVLEHPIGDLPGGRNRAAFVTGLAEPRLHQVIQRRIGRPGVKGQKCALFGGIRHARIHPGQVPDAAQIQER